ncbi:unnamed protein product [Withania somnifera]
MSRFPMNPYDEQRLIQEVHYLHSLWHQGPTRPHPHTHTHPHPLSYHHAATPSSLQPSSSTKFKKKNKRFKKQEFQDSGIEWTCKSPAKSPPSTESGWPSFKTQPNKQSHLPTVEELASVEANRVQQHAVKAVSEYLKYSVNAEDDDDDDEEEEDVMEVEKVDKEEKNVSFFEKLFEEDGGLREYYVKNSESGGGEFSCLVCCGVGKKGWKKRFKDCVALVQHSISIANANTRQAHRAYGQVICRILGWDINRLPSIVLSAGDKQPIEAQVLGSGPQRSSLANSNKGSNKTLQGNEDGGDGKNGLSGLSNAAETVKIGSDESSQEKQSFRNENTESASNCLGNEGDYAKNSLNGQQKEPFGNENQQEYGSISTASEHNSMSEANAKEDVRNAIPETAKENAEGASNCLDMSVANEENNR